MSSNTAALRSASSSYQSPTSTSKRAISLEQFLVRYTNREDSYKYEWNNGLVEKKDRTMNRDQTILLQRLLRLFDRTTAYAAMGQLLVKVNMFLSLHNRIRRPDIVYMPPEQIQQSGDGELSVCPFVIEVVSKNDKTNEVDQKLIEYFANGVEVVWLIFPQVKKVEVYRSLRDVTICYEADVCSAAPVLPDFSISVNELLA